MNERRPLQISGRMNGEFGCEWIRVIERLEELEVIESIVRLPEEVETREIVRDGLPHHTHIHTAHSEQLVEPYLHILPLTLHAKTRTRYHPNNRVWEKHTLRNGPPSM